MNDNVLITPNYNSEFDLSYAHNVLEITCYKPENNFETIISSGTNEYVKLLKKWKWFTYISCSSVIASYIIGFIVMGKWDSETMSYNDYNLLMGMISRWPECYDNRVQLWRFFSNILSHANLAHVSGNIIIMFGLSYMLELYQSSIIISPLFLIGVLHGNLAFYYTKPYSYALGVSGGVFAILGMNIANGLINIRVFPTLHTCVIMYTCAVLLISELLSYDESLNVAYICHWSSFVSGLIGGLAFLKHYKLSANRIYFSFSMSVLYFIYTCFLFDNYIFNWPPMYSYTNTLQEIDTVNCCYEWFKHSSENPDSIIDSYNCPYKVLYEDSFSRSVYKMS